MSFFIKKKSNPRKTEEKIKRTSSEVAKDKKTFRENLGANQKFSIDDSEDENEVENATSSDEELAETTQEKKLRLAKKYLEEIEAQEKERAGGGIIDRSVLENRIKGHYLEESGRIRKTIADEFEGYDAENIRVLRCKEQNQTVTCVVISANGKHIYSGSKDSSIIKWQFDGLRKLGVIQGAHKVPDEKKSQHHSGRILCLAITTDEEFLASGDDRRVIHIWSPSSLQHLHTFKAHKGAVTGLAVQRDSHQLFSVSVDRCVRVWNLDEMACVETLFGHQCSITAVDALSRERAVTCGTKDCSIRVWKIAEESQLVFNATRGGSVDCVKLLDEQHFFSGTDNGNLSVWSAGRKNPLCVLENAHGRDENGENNWISSVGCLINTDLVASGSRNGLLSLWKCEEFKRLKPVMNIPVKGFINGISFSKDGHHLVVAVGQEHRLGRWWSIQGAKNGVYVIPLIKKSVSK